MTSEEYIACFRTLARLTAQGLEKIANKSGHDREEGLLRAAEAVETLSSMRGDSSLFLDFRPVGLQAYQSEMYRTEDELRAKLVGLGYQYRRS